MGACASSPQETPKVCLEERMAEDEVVYALVSSKGDRHYEDCAKASPCIVRDGTCVNALFTVFDGHGGASVATQAASLLHTRIIEASHGKAPGELGEAIKLAFQETDAQCCGDSPHNEVGAVCCSAVFAGRQLWIGNVGDVRAVLCRRGGQAEVLTVDHRADNIQEAGRVERAGGTVKWSGGGPRVGGRLCVTRSFGDSWAKPFVIAEPDVRCVEVSPDCEFLIIASDGLWDHVSSTEAVRLVRSSVRDQQRDSRKNEEAAAVALAAGGRRRAGSVDSASSPKATAEGRLLKAARALADRARESLSSDDITVCIVDLQEHLETSSRTGSSFSESSYAGGGAGGLPPRAWSEGSASVCSASRHTDASSVPNSPATLVDAGRGGEASIAKAGDAGGYPDSPGGAELSSDWRRVSLFESGSVTCFVEEEGKAGATGLSGGGGAPSTIIEEPGPEPTAAGGEEEEEQKSSVADRREEREGSLAAKEAALVLLTAPQSHDPPRTPPPPPAAAAAACCAC